MSARSTSAEDVAFFSQRLRVTLVIDCTLCERCRKFHNKEGDAKGIAEEEHISEEENVVFSDGAEGEQTDADHMPGVSIGPDVSTVPTGEVGLLLATN